MAGRRRDRASAAAGRPISGSPKSPPRRRANGRRSSCATMRRPNAAPSRARSMVAAAEPPKPRGVAGSVWPIRNSWNRATENLYSAWIEKLFERRSTRRRHGRRCMSCCAIPRATCCTIISVCAKTGSISTSAPTAPTCPISCAPISPSRWACPTATRNARAAAAAIRRAVRCGGISRRKSRGRRRPRTSSRPPTRRRPAAQLRSAAATSAATCSVQAATSTAPKPRQRRPASQCRDRDRQRTPGFAIPGSACGEAGRAGTAAAARSARARLRPLPAIQHRRRRAFRRRTHARAPTKAPISIPSRSTKRSCVRARSMPTLTAIC